MDYETLATQESVDKAIAALKANRFDGVLVESGAAALAKIQELIPKGASVMNGTSTTLEQIGYVEYLKKGEHGWNNLHEKILAEDNPAEQALLRRQSVVSDYYVGSVHAVTEDGQLLIASNTGSQLPHLAYTSPNVILVASTKKITKDLLQAWERIDTHVVPLEDARLMKVYGAHTTHAKTLIMHKEGPKSTRKILVIFVRENLGF